MSLETRCHPKTTTTGRTGTQPGRGLSRPRRRRDLLCNRSIRWQRDPPHATLEKTWSVPTPTPSQHRPRRAARISDEQRRSQRMHIALATRLPGFTPSLHISYLVLRQQPGCDELSPPTPTHHFTGNPVCLSAYSTTLSTPDHSRHVQPTASQFPADVQPISS